MQNLWAPWRAEYFLNEKPKECIFCAASAQKNPQGDPSTDAQNYVLIRDRTCFCILNAFPYSGGHLMVSPYRHTGELNDLTDDELKDLFLLMRRCKNILQKAFHPDGFNVGFNLGTAGGAGFADHLHLHIVPRWSGDANFMAVLSDTRVVNEGLKQTYDKLMQHVNSN